MFPMVGMSRFWEFEELDSQQLSHRHSPGAMGAEASSVYRRPKPPSCSWLKYIVHKLRKDGGNYVGGKRKISRTIKTTPPSSQRMEKEATTRLGQKKLGKEALDRNNIERFSLIEVPRQKI